MSRQTSRQAPRKTPRFWTIRWSNSASRAGHRQRRPARGRIDAALVGHVLRGLRRHHRAGAEQASTACCAADGQRGRPARRGALGPAAHAAVAAGRRVRRAGYGAAPDAAAPARELRRAESRKALWRLFVAAFCMMQVMMLATPSYVAGAGRDRARPARSCSTGQLGAEPAGAAVFGGAVLQRRLARAAPAAHRHGRAGGARHRRDLRRQHRRHLRPRRRVRPRGLLRFADDVRRLPAGGALRWSCARASARRRRWRPRWTACPTGRAAARRRPQRAGQRAAPGAAATGCGSPAGRPSRPMAPARRPHAGRRGAAHRRIDAGGQAARRRGGGRQPQPGRAGDDAGAARRRRHALRGHRRADARRA